MPETPQGSSEEREFVPPPQLTPGKKYGVQDGRRFSTPGPHSDKSNPASPDDPQEQ